MSDFRWLIEAPGQRYLAARHVGDYHFHWTQDHNEAIAFRCEAQADMTMMAIRNLAPALFDFERTIGNAKAIEHAWMVAVENVVLPFHDETMDGLRKLTIRDEEPNEANDFWARGEHIPGVTR